MALPSHSGGTSVSGGPSRNEGPPDYVAHTTQDRMVNSIRRGRRSLIENINNSEPSLTRHTLWNLNPVLDHLNTLIDTSLPISIMPSRSDHMSSLLSSVDSLSVSSPSSPSPEVKSESSEDYVWTDESNESNEGGDSDGYVQVKAVRFSDDAKYQIPSELPKKQMSRAKLDPSQTRASYVVNSAPAYPLTPSWVTPPVCQTTMVMSGKVPYMPSNRRVIAPLKTLTRRERRAQLFAKLISTYETESSLLLAIYLGPKTAPVNSNVGTAGVHVFIDGSNIIIGFQECLKRARGMAKHTYTSRAPFSYKSFATVLERGRPIARRCLLGSVDRSGLPEYMREAEKCGYEVSALERVEKRRDYTDRKNCGGNGYVTSSQSSGSEAPLSKSTKTGEQGVDEILQMKMLESLIDCDEPSTMVLATGDAAEAEFSAGFLRNVERALNKGWQVELVSWKANMSSAWRAKAFTKKWKGQFKIIELDWYSEEFLTLK
ncbi:MAG: hypothetical protein M1818_000619 [Claussenomyces sp. TS43310]|nr:MAG: hypothetical protein M1818_000619 [Claussenomyces sp. TS43310]